MRYLTGFRDRDAAAHIGGKLAKLGSVLAARGGSLRIMEVCGTHTMAIARFGIRQFLPENVDLVSGPGCPVCVTDPGYIDCAVELARKGVVLATFGDLIRVPGSDMNLAEIRARGADVRVCYSPAEAPAMAREDREREYVFLAVGFETTVAPFAALLDGLSKDAVKNFSLLTAFKRIPPAIFALLSAPDIQVDAFLLPAHVSAIIGTEPYRPIAEEHGAPGVVAGFEPLDILYGLMELTRQVAENDVSLTNHYSRVVRARGNTKALALMDRYLEPGDGSWRGIGTIPRSALTIRPAFGSFDAALRHGTEIRAGRPDKKCRCGEVLTGKIRPDACGLFDRKCTPEHPVGPCMVSSEGSCAAAHRYGGYGGRT